MLVNRAGLALIKTYEGLRLAAYRCPAGIPTIGYGHTGKDVRIGMRIDEATADALLVQDATRFSAGVAELVSLPLSGNRFSALVSFAFNVGLGRLAGSTLLARLNGGDMAGAASQFDRWTRAAGSVLPGLVARRAAERTLFETAGDGDALDDPSA